jgi:predicted RNA-binding Zn-ribbon protein involved in translation (DUF1610 family)
MSEAMRVKVAGERLQCKHCGANVFFREETALDRLGLAGPADLWGHHATIYVCSSCGFLHWFFAIDLGRHERTDAEEAAERVECLACGLSIPAGASACPGCGWSWESAGPGSSRSGAGRLGGEVVDELPEPASEAAEPLTSDGSHLSLEDLLDRVDDRDSFIAFVDAMAAEREEAERMERTERDRYQFGGALDWQNSDISAFLLAALAYFQPSASRKPESTPSWRMFAAFLYFGKIYE